MVDFDLWRESFIFVGVYGAIIIVPCIIVALIGMNMIDKLGYFPTKTPAIQMSIFLKLIITEVITFVCLIGFYHVMQGGK